MAIHGALTSGRVRRAVAFRLSRALGLLLDRLSGEARLACNACGRRTTGFAVFGGGPNRCTYCDSTAKERIVLAAMDAGLLTVPKTGCRSLHVAPSELEVSRRLRAAGDYIAVDLHPGIYHGVPVRGADITKLRERQGEFGEFDVIYASHVLEHIPDDAGAMRAMCASLKPEGEAWILVPLHDAPTEEDLALTDPKQRERRFGQWDHVRQYGPDIRDRLERAGFSVRVVTVDDLPGEAVFRHGLRSDDVIFVCRRA